MEYLHKKKYKVLIHSDKIYCLTENGFIMVMHINKNIMILNIKIQNVILDVVYKSLYLFIIHDNHLLIGNNYNEYKINLSTFTEAKKKRKNTHTVNIKRVTAKVDHPQN